MRGKTWTVILSVCMILSAVGCANVENTDDPIENTESPTNEVIEKKEELRTINIMSGEAFKYTRVNDSYTNLLDMSYPIVRVCGGDENEFKELERAFEAKQDEEKEKLFEFIEENEEAADELYKEQGNGFQAFESKVKPIIRRADTLVTSVLYSAFDYCGGAHGSYYYYGENYDTRTGEKLSLSDVVDSKKALYRAISEQLDMFYYDVYSGSIMDIKDVLEDKNAFSWTLDYNGITFYFMPFTIADTAMENLSVTVSNEEYPDVIEDKFKALPMSYGIELANGLPFYFDVDDDGDTDEIILSANEVDFNGGSGSISISVNGKKYEKSEWFYESEATFVHLSDGSDYIYLEITVDNGYATTYCYNVDGDVSEIGSVDGALRRTYYDGKESFVLQDALTNPEMFYLEKTTQHLSTVRGYKKYHAGSNGIPIAETEQYTFDEKDMHTFTLLKDIQCDIYDETRETVSGTKNLKNGDKVMYYSTDGEKYAILKCEDGTLCRVEAGISEDYAFRHINGMEIYDVFDGLFFAG